MLRKDNSVTKIFTTEIKKDRSNPAFNSNHEMCSPTANFGPLSKGSLNHCVFIYSTRRSPGVL